MKTTKKIIVTLLGTAALVACQPKQGNTGKENSGDVDQSPMAVLVDTPKITVPPDSLKLDKFYKKYMNVNGIHVCSSWRVPDSCFYAAAISIKGMTDALSKDVMKAMTDRKTRIGIMIETSKQHEVRLYIILCAAIFFHRRIYLFKKVLSHTIVCHQHFLCFRTLGNTQFVIHCRNL